MHLELVRLHLGIGYLERIEGFDADLYGVGTRSGGFFYLFTLNTFDASALVVTRLATDPPGEKLTFGTFENQLTTDLLKEEHRDAFKVLFAVPIDAQHQETLECIRKYRSHAVAHNLRQKGPIRPTLDALRTTCAALVRRFERCAFEVDYRFDLLPYTDDSWPDIDTILDRIVTGSLIFDLPERNPDRWRVQREGLPAASLDQFNRYRVKHELQPA